MSDTPTPKAADLAKALRHAIATACNDDDTVPKSYARRRHVERITAMAEAAEFLEAGSHNAA